MAAILQFIFFIIGAILQLLIWAIIINAILSWLVAFDVINLRNRFVYNVARALEDRKSVGEGKSVNLGGRRIIKKKNDESRIMR